MRPEASIAPIRLRLLAGVIDVVVVIGISGAIAACALRWRMVDDTWEQRMNRLGETLAEPRVQRTVKVASPVAAVALRSVRSPGLRVAGLRKVNARTGGPVTLHGAITAQLWHFVEGRLFRRFGIPLALRGGGGGCLLAIGLPLALRGAAALRSRRHQTIDDRIAGVVVIRDDR